MDISAYQHMNIRMSTRGKRPLRNLTPNDKVRAIQRIHNGETKASVSRDIGVPESTLRGWCKNEQKLRFMCRQLGTDQLSIATSLENPPEKRSKFEANLTAQKFSSLANYENFAYNHLQLSGMDLSGTNNTTTNSILEKMAFNEFLKKNGPFQSEAGKQSFSGIAGNNHLTAMSSLPITADYSQLSMMQNLNLLSLLNPSLTAMSSAGLSAGSSDLIEAGSKIKVPLRTSNSLSVNEDRKDSAQKNAAISALTVKNWAKESPENVNANNNGCSGGNGAANNNNNNNKRSTNDTNNNDVKLMSAVTPVKFPETPPILSSPFPAGLLQIPTVNGADTDSSNAALLEWCKVFNASLNFLALAAAAAALQSPTQTAANDNEENTIKNSDDAEQHPAENILYKQLTKAAQRNFTGGSSDASNDSYFDSEPEDLSLRSTTSKISSPANSRSQSPTKSTASISSSIQSDDEAQ